MAAADPTHHRPPKPHRPTPRQFHPPPANRLPAVQARCPRTRHADQETPSLVFILLLKVKVGEEQQQQALEEEEPERKAPLQEKKRG